MRVEFANAIIKHNGLTPNQVFITGDLGFMALEGVREAFDSNFINGGIAEQNIVTVAAAMAHEGFIPWVYSISPFITLRPYEQIRNDVCHHNHPVKIVGNGGGYGYGIMGATHHNLEDIGIMRILPNMKVYVPFLGSDVEECVSQMLLDKSPNYLRLNLGANINKEIEPFKTWRKLKSGKKAIVIGTGPVVANLFGLDEHILEDIEIWLVSRFPIVEIPKELLKELETKRCVITMEEHNGQCGLYETIAAQLLSNKVTTNGFYGLFANGYPSGKYGSQKWHQAENNLEGDNLKNKIIEFLIDA
jgi:transketolase